MTHPTDIRGDVQLAYALADGRPTGQAADALRTRLQQHIATLTGPADQYAQACPDTRLREIIDRALTNARQLLAASSPDDATDPAEELRLLAGCVVHLSQLHQHTAGWTHRSGPPPSTPAAPPSPLPT